MLITFLRGQKHFEINWNQKHGRSTAIKLHSRASWFPYLECSSNCSKLWAINTKLDLIECYNKACLIGVTDDKKKWDIRTTPFGLWDCDSNLKLLNKFWMKEFRLALIYFNFVYWYFVGFLYLQLYNSL